MHPALGVGPVTAMLGGLLGGLVAMLCIVIFAAGCIATALIISMVFIWATNLFDRWSERFL